MRYSLKNPRPELSDPPTVCKILVAVKREGIGRGRESKQYRPSSSSHAALATASGTVELIVLLLLLCVWKSREQAAYTLLFRSCRPSN